MGGDWLNAKSDATMQIKVGISPTEIAGRAVLKEGNLLQNHYLQIIHIQGKTK